LHIHLYFKSCTLVPDNGPLGREHVEFIDDIKSWLCLKAIYMSIILVMWARISSLIYTTCLEAQNKGSKTGRNVGKYKPTWRGV